MSDLQLQQYLFDVQGYLVVENVLSPEEVAALNQCVDEQQLPTPGKVQRFGSAPEGPGFLQWGQPFCDLLDHPRLCRYFNSVWVIAFDSIEFTGCICGKVCRADGCTQIMVRPLQQQEQIQENTTPSEITKSITGSLW